MRRIPGSASRLRQRVPVTEAVFADSEIGPLESVIVHTPGIEIEAMTPTTLAEVLYNDIVPLGVVAEEHARLKGVLSLFAEVLELKDLLRESLSSSEVAADLVDRIVRSFGIEGRRGELLALGRDELIRLLIGGLPARRDSLARFLDPKEFDLNPLPNLYFTRDGAMVYRNSVLIGAMAHEVRQLEALLAGFIFRYHPRLRPSGLLFDGASERIAGVTLEGGDFQLLKEDLLVMGLSDRTTSGAIDLIAERIAATRDSPLRVFAVLLPSERATIHLDMIFTMVDRDRAVVYAPHILGKDRRPVVRMDVDPQGRRSIRRVDGLLEGLAEAGLALEPILCGMGDPLLEQREQWLSGTNFLAVAPGKILGYSCNPATLEALDRAGFAICGAEGFLSGRESPFTYERLVIAVDGIELARGGGGVRCMTMPVRRAPLAW